MEGETVSFSDTERVKDQIPQQTFSSNDAEEVSNGDGPDAGTPNFRKEQVHMDFLEKLRVKLGLPEGATEDQILESAHKAPANLSEGDNSGAPATVAVSEAVLTAMQTEFAQTQTELAQLKAERAAEKRDAFIMSCLSEGRIHVSEREFWRGALDKDEEGTTAFLSARTPVVPVSELGSTAAGNTEPGNLSDDELKNALSSFGMLG